MVAGDVVKPFKRTALSSAFLILSFGFLAGWLVSMLFTSFVVMDMRFLHKHVWTLGTVLAGLVATFGCYVAYLASSIAARAVKYPRAQDEPNTIV